MKVKELIEQLKQANQEAEIVLAKDSEGNEYSPLDGWSEGLYAAENTYSGDFYSLRDLEEEESDYFEGDEVVAICLHPVN